VAGQMPGMVERAVEGLDEVNAVTVDLVWDPPWDKSRMSDEARLKLGFM
jgi:metal-sulfur cluster biosynthetic enzyme